MSSNEINLTAHLMVVGSGTWTWPISSRVEDFDYIKEDVLKEIKIHRDFLMEIHPSKFSGDEIVEKFIGQPWKFSIYGIVEGILDRTVGPPTTARKEEARALLNGEASDPQMTILFKDDFVRFCDSLVPKDGPLRDSLAQWREDNKSHEGRRNLDPLNYYLEGCQEGIRRGYLRGYLGGLLG